MKFRLAALECALLMALVFGQAAPPASAQTRNTQSRKTAPSAAAPQKMDEEYTRLIKEYLQDPRITTELVDHMPGSDTVPSPLKFLGRIPGKPSRFPYPS